MGGHMKIDRLMAITIYLLNQGKTSAQKLAKEFEVSARTIMRDMDALDQAGIPIQSTYGVDGGYQIVDTYVMEKQVANRSDYDFIVTALKGLASAYTNKNMEKTLNKMNSLVDNKISPISVDFGTAHENKMINIYEKCPVLENDHYLLRFVEENDVKDLVKVYGDKNALPYFNSDNCFGENFYYPTEERMLEAIKLWISEYSNKAYVRFSIIDKRENKVIGTTELFNRKSSDYFNDCGILRLDVRSDVENATSLYDIMSIIIEPAYQLFGCSMIATKAALYAVDRAKALEKIGFQKTKEHLIGHYDTYGDYWVIKNC